ncbi:MAG: AAA family ATPase [Verrucomicrobiae bacterium]|nr:AAA family ATPase [Verrucomicrobiae bacterium]
MRACIAVQSGGLKGSQFLIDNDPYSIGSDADCSLAIGEPGVIGKHALIEKRRGRWQIRAPDAANPLQVEGKFTTECFLEHGASFTLGNVLFTFLTDNTAIERDPFAGAEVENPEEAAACLHEATRRITEQIGQVVIGQQSIVYQILVALFARGHCLLVGAPGLAKTLMARAMAGTLDLECRRIQFTPDLMPADITGTNILEEDPATRSRRFRFKRGPIFANLLLADEINRTPPKTQAALLEAMQERRVTASGVTYDLPQPFFVIATQNPIEQEGTYPLPEAQLDRFMFCLKVGYPAAEDEQRVIMETTRQANMEVKRILDAETLLKFQYLVRQTPISDHVGLYATRLIRAARPGSPDAPEFINRWIRWGTGTRAGQYLLLAAKTHAILQGRFNVSCADVREFALPVIRHRLVCNYAAASEGVDTDDIVKKLLEAVPEPTY